MTKFWILEFNFVKFGYTLFEIFNLINYAANSKFYYKKQ